MESSTIAIFAVAGERVFVVAAALTSIVLGWNLFTRAIVVNQEGTVSIGDWKVELKAVGPGVFFSLFGTIVLLYVLLRPAEYTATKATGNSGNQQSETYHALGVGEAADTTTLGYIRAINTIAQIEKQVAAQPAGSSAMLTGAQVSDLKSAAARLTEWRQVVLVRKFGGNTVNEWQANADTFENQRTALSPDMQARLAKIAPWMTETVANEAGAK